MYPTWWVLDLPKSLNEQKYNTIVWLKTTVENEKMVERQTFLLKSKRKTS